jgi:hypothetical protein
MPAILPRGLHAHVQADPIAGPQVAHDGRRQLEQQLLVAGRHGHLAPRNIAARDVPTMACLDAMPIGDADGTTATGTAGPV